MKVLCAIPVVRFFCRFEKVAGRPVNQPMMDLSTGRYRITDAMPEGGGCGGKVREGGWLEGRWR